MHNSKKQRAVAPRLPILDLEDFPNAISAATGKLPAEFDLNFKFDHAIQVDPRWENILSEIIQFKVAVDNVVHGAEDDLAASNHLAILEKYEVEWTHLRRDTSKCGSYCGLTNTWPEHFLPNFVFGHFECIDDLSLKAVGWMPPWVRVGRLYDPKSLRRANTQLSMADQERTIAAMERENAHDSTSSSGWLFGGIPLVQAGENKNRYQFYHRYGLNQFVRLYVSSYPKPEELRLQRVPFQRHMIALHRQATCGRKIETSLLPLGDLASPVLESYGVTWLPGVWHGYFSPFSVVIAEDKKVPWLQRLTPKQFWRKLVYGHHG